MKPTRHSRRPLPAVLTIAGSDSGGGAGIQADLKTFAALGVFGTSAITCLTAQNPSAVTGIAAVDPAMVTRQIRAIVEGFPIRAAKTGMLYSAPVIRAVAAAVRRGRIAILVADPVMIATSGARLLREDAVRALCERLLPLATVITPNLPEAEVLCGHAIPSLAALKAAAREIGERFGTSCVVKGGHLAGARVADVLYWAARGRTGPGGTWHVFSGARVAARETHGTGCTFSAALAALLARGEPLPTAVRSAKCFVQQALVRARPVGRHWPLLPE